MLDCIEMGGQVEWPVCFFNGSTFVDLPAVTFAPRENTGLFAVVGCWSVFTAFLICMNELNGFLFAVNERGGFVCCKRTQLFCLL